MNVTNKPTVPSGHSTTPQKIAEALPHNSAQLATASDSQSNVHSTRRVDLAQWATGSAPQPNVHITPVVDMRNAAHPARVTQVTPITQRSPGTDLNEEDVAAAMVRYRKMSATYEKYLKHITASPESEDMEQSFKIADGLINMLDAVNNISGHKTVKLSDEKLAAVLLKRVESRNRCRKQDGTQGTINDLLDLWAPAKAPSSSTVEEMPAPSEELSVEHRASVISATLPEMLTLSAVLAVEHQANVADLRRACKLKSSLHGKAADTLKLAHVQAIYDQAPMLVCVNGALEIEHEIHDALEQQAPSMKELNDLLFDNLLRLFASKPVELDDQWGEQMAPVLRDLSNLLLDYSTTAIELPDMEFAEPTQVQAWSRAQELILTLGTSLCPRLTDLIDERKKDEPPQNKHARKRAAAKKPDSGIISVLNPKSGMTVPASLDPSSMTATSSGVIEQKYKKVEGVWVESIPELDTETALLTAPLVEDDTELEPVGPSPKSIRTLNKLMTAAKELLSIDLQPLDKEMFKLKHCMGHINPDFLENRFLGLADTWKPKLARMTEVAGHLERRVGGAASLALAPGTEPLTELIAALRARAESLRSSLVLPTRHALIQTYGNPNAKQWTELFDAGLVTVSAPKALASDPAQTLYEFCLSTPPDIDGTPYDPTWVHLHLTGPVPPEGLLTLGPSMITAAHLKSNADRGRGREWEEAQRAQGKLVNPVHRSPLPDELLKRIVSMAFGPQPTPAPVRP